MKIIKIKNLLAISIFLMAILTIGAVSAEDISNTTVGNVIDEDNAIESPQSIDDGLGEIDESTDEILLQNTLNSIENETIQASESQSDPLLADDIIIQYDVDRKYGEKEFCWRSDVWIIVDFSQRVTGTLTIQINNPTLTENLDLNVYCYQSLKNYMVYGDNHISVKFEGDHSYNTYTDVCITYLTRAFHEASIMAQIRQSH